MNYKRYIKRYKSRYENGYHYQPTTEIRKDGYALTEETTHRLSGLLVITHFVWDGVGSMNGKTYPVEPR